MIYVVLFFLAFALLLYVVLAGADFGAGILEFFSSKKNQKITKKTLYRVMGPVWEANHIWIIIILVILWVAFPYYYHPIMIALHIPFTLILMGITLRGVSFVFRHYDAYQDKSQVIYDRMFKISSLLTPIFLGITFGAMINGKIILNGEADFKTLYIHPWLSVFPVLIGLFFASLCCFLSAILLIGAAEEENRNLYIKKSIIATITVVILGLIALIYGYIQELKFIIDFLKNPYALLLIFTSAILLIPLWISIKKGFIVSSRILAGIQVIFIITAAVSSHFPDLLITSQGTISILENLPPKKVISTLGISLIIGGIIILPGLFHLFKSFKMIKILERE